MVIYVVIIYESYLGHSDREDNIKHIVMLSMACLE